MTFFRCFYDLIEYFEKEMVFFQKFQKDNFQEFQEISSINYKYGCIVRNLSYKFQFNITARFSLDEYSTKCRFCMCLTAIQFSHQCSFK